MASNIYEMFSLQQTLWSTLLLPTPTTYEQMTSRAKDKDTVGFQAPSSWPN